MIPDSPIFVRREQDPGLEGPRRCPPDPGDVHRFDRSAWTPPPDIRGRRQRDRRGARRILRPDRRPSLTETVAAASWTTGAGSRPTSIPSRRRPGVEVVMTMLHAGGKFDGVKLQGLRRSPRRRRVGRQRALRMARGEGLPEGRRSSGSATNGATSSPTSTSSARRIVEGPSVRFKPDPEIFDETVFDYDTVVAPASGAGIPESQRQHPPARRAGRPGADLPLRGWDAGSSSTS